MDGLLGDVLNIREQDADDTTPSALRQLATLLMDRPESQVKMALDVCTRVFEEMNGAPPG